MSTIWRECEGEDHVGPLAFEAWRVVEGQHVVATRKLVDSLAEQEVLEALLEEAKPPLPAHTRLERLHYLLFTPFRYPPLRHGSRFGSRDERGIWYGSRSRATALAERAYYRLLFLAGSTADLGPLRTEETVFRATVRAGRGVDLTAPPFSQHAASIAAPGSYAATQPLGSAMRAAGVEACLFPSARDPRRGANCALFQPVFRGTRPLGPETWACTAQASGVEFRNRILGLALVFERGAFEIDGALPVPGV